MQVLTHVVCLNQIPVFSVPCCIWVEFFPCLVLLIYFFLCKWKEVEIGWKPGVSLLGCTLYCVSIIQFFCKSPNIWVLNMPDSVNVLYAFVTKHLVSKRKSFEFWLWIAHRIKRNYILFSIYFVCITQNGWKCYFVCTPILIFTIYKLVHVPSIW